MNSNNNNKLAKVITHIVATIYTITMCYGLTAFVIWEYDITQWSSTARLICLMMMIIGISSNITKLR